MHECIQLSMQKNKDSKCKKALNQGSNKHYKKIKKRDKRECKKAKSKSQKCFQVRK